MFVNGISKDGDRVSARLLFKEPTRRACTSRSDDHRRRNPKRASLSYREIAVLKVARAWPAYVDGDWADVARSVRKLVHDLEIRPTELLDAARFEPGDASRRLRTLFSVG